MDAVRLEALRAQLAALDLPAAEIEHQIALAVADEARPPNEADRMVVLLQQKDVYGS